MPVILNQRHVVQHPDGGWAVKKPNSERASSRHSTQAEASDRAREILSLGGGGEAVIHGRNGRIRESDTVSPATADWSLLSAHGRVLVYIGLCPGSTVPEIARAIGQTERSIWGIVRTLMDSGMLRLRKQTRRNLYSINLDAPLLHPTITGMTLRPVMEGIIAGAEERSTDVCEEMQADAPRLRRNKRD